MKLIKRLLYLIWKLISGILMVLLMVLTVLLLDPIISLVHFLIKGSFKETDTEYNIIRIIDWVNTLDDKFYKNCK